MGRQLFRSINNRMIAGVCGGIAEYFSIDPTIVRILWVAFSLFSMGAGIVAYIIALIVIPEQSYGGSYYNQTSAPVNIDGHKISVIIGAALIIFGILLLGKRYLYWIDFKLVWPIILIGLGIYTLIRSSKKY